MPSRHALLTGLLAAVAAAGATAFVLPSSVPQSQGGFRTPRAATSVVRAYTQQMDGGSTH